jgi:osmotically-inducible protein OsmY
VGTARAWPRAGTLAAALALLVGVACVRSAVVNPGLGGPAVDRQLRERIELRLSIDHRLCPYAIRVVVHDRIVELTGLVDNLVEQQRAAEIARAAGALHVVDHLERRLSSGDPGRC